MLVDARAATGLTFLPFHPPSVQAIVAVAVRPAVTPGCTCLFARSPHPSSTCCMQDRKGASNSAIKKYIISKYGEEFFQLHHYKRALNKALEAGTVRLSPFCATVICLTL